MLCILNTKILLIRNLGSWWVEVSVLWKMNKLEPPDERIEVVVKLSRLGGFVRTSYETAKKKD